MSSTSKRAEVIPASGTSGETTARSSSRPADSVGEPPRCAIGFVHVESKRDLGLARGRGDSYGLWAIRRGHPRVRHPPRHLRLELPGGKADHRRPRGLRLRRKRMRAPCELHHPGRMSVGPNLPANPELGRRPTDRRKALSAGVPWRREAPRGHCASPSRHAAAPRAVACFVSAVRSCGSPRRSSGSRWSRSSPSVRFGYRVGVDTFFHEGFASGDSTRFFSLATGRARDFACGRREVPCVHAAW